MKIATSDARPKLGPTVVKSKLRTELFIVHLLRLAKPLKYMLRPQPLCIKVPPSGESVLCAIGDHLLGQHAEADSQSPTVKPA